MYSYFKIYFLMIYLSAIQMDFKCCGNMDLNTIWFNFRNYDFNVIIVKKYVKKYYCDVCGYIFLIGSCWKMIMEWIIMIVNSVILIMLSIYESIVLENEYGIEEEEETK